MVANINAATLYVFDSLDSIDWCYQCDDDPGNLENAGVHRRMATVVGRLT